MFSAPPAMKPDPTFPRALVALILLSVIFFVIERMVGRGRAQPIVRRGWWTDIVYWFATILLTKPLVRLMLILPVSLLLLTEVTTIDIVKLGEYRGFGPLSRQPVWLQAIEIYALVDLIGYWTHRLFHAGKGWLFMRSTTARRTSTGLAPFGFIPSTIS
jgi:sterol desaturase/sphingolipid hydroxylase (fatty acid hydroxylase superfamily)